MMRPAFAAAAGALACLAVAVACGSSSPRASADEDAPGADAPSTEPGDESLGDDASTSPDCEGTDATLADGSAGDDSEADAAEEDVTYVNPEDVVWCKGPVQEAGFASLSQFPFASYCAGPFSNTVYEATTPCQGTLIVGAADGTDCGDWWLFDATTGALEATGGGCNGSFSCGGATPGFEFPYQCFINGGWAGINPCIDGGYADASGE